MSANQRLVPKHFVSDGIWAWFVDGYTSDQTSDWRLRFAKIDPVTKTPDCTKVHTYWTIVEAPEPMLPMLPGDLILDMTFLVGNVQRMCQGIPAIRKGL